MKIAIISDIHGNIDGLNAVLKDVGNVDMILCAGDLTGYYPFINEVIDKVKKNNIITIKGNHDKYLVDSRAPEDASDKVKQSVDYIKKIISSENLEYLKSLPDCFDNKIDNKRVLMYHASPWDIFEERIYPDYNHFEKFDKINVDVLILGHTHYPMVKQIDSLTLINPGSCVQPRDYNLLSYVMWDTEDNTFENRRLEWDIDEFIHKSLEKGVDLKLFKVFDRIKKLD